MPEDKYLSVTEAAKHYDVPAHKIRNAIKKGLIPAKKVGWNWMIPVATMPATLE
jgi:excisionase family DNA binding protein